MSEAKFTKGPWLFGMHNIIDAEKYNVDSEIDCGWSYIGTQNKCVAMTVTKSYSDDELDANTSLIAAAPEMYEMLATLSMIVHDELSRDIAREIDDLLAKARGES